MENQKPRAYFEVRPHVSHYSFHFDNRLVSSFLHVDNHWVWQVALKFTPESTLERKGFRSFSIDRRHDS